MCSIDAIEIGMVSLRQMNYPGELRQLNERVRPFYGAAEFEMITSHSQAIFSGKT